MGGTGPGTSKDGSPRQGANHKQIPNEEATPLLPTTLRRTSEVTADLEGPPAPVQLESCPSHRSLCSSGPEKVIGTCRICFEQETKKSQDPNNPLICPCQCSGSSKFVHRQCLQQWRETKHRADAFYQCEVCKYRYRYQRLWWASVLGHQITLLIMFSLLMAAFISALGFVPITNRMFTTSSSSSSSSGTDSSPVPGGDSSSSIRGISVPYTVIHILNGVVMLGVVGLVMGVLLLFGRACGIPAVALFPDSLWCPCVWCLELNGNGVPILGECAAASGGECCLALGAVFAVVMLVVGVMMAAYMLYIVLWLLVQAGLSRAQHMVENVQQESGKEKDDSSSELLV